jgi:hypothetical protein
MRNLTQDLESECARKNSTMPILLQKENGAARNQIPAGTTVSTTSHSSTDAWFSSDETYRK